MRHLLCVLLGASASWISLAAPALAQKTKPPITWERTIVDNDFRAEGVAVADFNKDGKLDIFIGDAWYEGPDWKRHIIRRDKPFDPRGYSESFCCFVDDYNGDGYPDVIVIPFPGKACPWYENPGKTGGKWKEHILATSACNETPIFVDLFKTGKKVLVMAWPPSGADTMGQMFYFTPGKDPTKLWDKNPISVPSEKEKGKEVPGTRKFSHGLGHGDVNGDGRLDIMVTAGWWEQPEKVDGTPWKFHAANLGDNCADMYARDLNGDKLADVISTSAHGLGLWWHQQLPGFEGTKFAKQTLATGEALLKDPRHHRLTPDEKAVLDAINRLRATQKPSALPAFKPSAFLCARARQLADRAVAKGVKESVDIDDKGALRVLIHRTPAADSSAAELAKYVLEKDKDGYLLKPFRDIGIAVARKDKDCLIQIALTEDRAKFDGSIVVWDNILKNPVSQTHALIEVDIDGDGLKDYVTGRRWWAHGAAGDPASDEPAFLFWLRASKDDKGNITFTPEVIDDDCGIGTQFVVVDIDGDGLPDVIVSNKRGVYINRQVAGGARTPPGRKE